MKKKLWFVRKRYGWGWTPSSWEGFLVLFAYVGAMFYIFRDINNTSYSDSDLLASFIIPSSIATLALIAICYKKGESPRWQWGNDQG